MPCCHKRDGVDDSNKDRRGVGEGHVREQDRAGAGAVELAELEGPAQVGKKRWTAADLVRGGDTDTEQIAAEDQGCDVAATEERIVAAEGDDGHHAVDGDGAQMGGD